MTGGACACRADERERSRVKRLLMEGMKTARETPGSVFATAGEQANDPCRKEAHGHLAAALLPMMAEATDERLGTLASPRFLPVLSAGLKMGADGPPLLRSPLQEE